jgi:CelD/BcsL family acetyltransferase involved in cellulose biosynthesis
MSASGAQIHNVAAVCELNAAATRVGESLGRAELLHWRAALADHAFVAAWDNLSAVACEPNAFLARWYLASALDALDNANDVRLAAVWHDERLVGLLPLYLRSSYAGLSVTHVQNWLNHNAFLGTPLIARTQERYVWRSVLELLDRFSGRPLFAHLSGLGMAGPVANALAAECAAQRRQWAVVQSEERALLEHGLPPEAYLDANMRGKKRKELRRQHSRLAELGRVEFARSDGGEQLEEWIDEFLKLERRGWKGRNGSALDCADDTRQLFRGALHGAAAAGNLELLALRLDGRAIAMLVTFITLPGAFSFKTAFDEDYARFSPGVLLQIENLKLLERDDILWCDSCAAQDHPMIDSIWSGRRSIGRYSIAIGGPVRRMVFATLLAAEKAKAKLKGRALK